MARAVCKRCLRPQRVCVCGTIEAVNNRTGVIILQHPAEHRHPLGTVLLARLGLRNVRHHVHWNLRHAPPADLDLPPGTVLLYPGDEATDLATLAPTERPEHLLVLDGTWSQSRVLMAANPWLAELPRVCVEASRPSRYENVRREPSAEYVSTVEAIVEAIAALEPELEGLDTMLRSLETMVAHQQRFADTPTPRFKKRSPRKPQHVPTLLRQSPERVVVVHCETSVQRREDGSTNERVIAVHAQRLADGDDGLLLYLQPQGPLPADAHLREMGINAADLEAGTSIKEASQRLRDYVGTQGVLAAWNQRTLERVLPLAGPRSTLMLKGIYCNLRHQRCGHVGSVAEAEGLSVALDPAAPRAARRLRYAVAVADWLARREAPADAALGEGASSGNEAS